MNRESRRIALCGVMVALGAAVMMAGGVIPVMTFCSPAIAGLTLLPILRETGMDMADIMEIITAVGNHEEQSGFISSNVSAALALGDKSDAHKSRVRNGQPDITDIHDRVNFSIQENRVTVDREKRIIRHELTMDDTSSVLEYLQIYLQRIVMCEKAAAFLNCSFELVINGQTVNNRPHRAPAAE